MLEPDFLKGRAPGMDHAQVAMQKGALLKMIFRQVRF
jgi:hypothetical protein